MFNQSGDIYTRVFTNIPQSNLNTSLGGLSQLDNLIQVFLDQF